MGQTFPGELRKREWRLPLFPFCRLFSECFIFIPDRTLRFSWNVVSHLDPSATISEIVTGFRKEICSQKCESPVFPFFWQQPDMNLLPVRWSFVSIDWFSYWEDVRTTPERASLLYVLDENRKKENQGIKSTSANCTFPKLWKRKVTHFRPRLENYFFPLF